MGRNSVKRQYKRQSKRKQNRGKKTKSRMSARQSGGVGGGSAPTNAGPEATRHDMSHHCTWGNRKYEGKLAYLYCWCGNKRRDPGNDAMDWELQRQ